METEECFKQVVETEVEVVSQCDAVFTEPNAHIEKVSYKLGGKYCCARWCNNSRRTKPDITLFRLPVKEKERVLQWLKNASREDLIGKNSKYLHSLRLCHEHFSDNMFMNVTKKRLNQKAIPEFFTKPDLVRLLDERRVKKHLVKDLAESSQLQAKHQRQILPKTDLPTPCSVMLLSASVLKGTQCSTLMTDNSCHHLNIVGHLEVLPEIELDMVGASGVASKLVDVDSESLSGYFADRDQAFSETESVCADHSFQKWADTIYPCPSCGEMFLFKSNLIRHQTTFHSEQLVQCETCGTGVVSKSEFLEHLCIGNQTFQEDQA